MKITMGMAIAAAEQAARTVWKYAEGPTAFAWRDAFRMSGMVLAQFVAARPEATAADLYRFAVADEAAPAAWEDLPPSLRVAFEVFRGTFAALYREMEAARAAGHVGAMVGGVLAVADRMTVLDGSRDELRLRRVPIGTGSPPTPNENIIALERAWDSDTGRPRSKRKGTV